MESLIASTTPPAGAPAGPVPAQLAVAAEQDGSPRTQRVGASAAAAAAADSAKADEYLFYQSADGQPLFLGALNYRCGGRARGRGVPSRTNRLPAR
jgi:hypothetical protein